MQLSRAGLEQGAWGGGHYWGGVEASQRSWRAGIGETMQPLPESSDVRRLGVTPAELRAHRLPERQVAVVLRATRRGAARLDPRGPVRFWSGEDSAPPSVPATGGPSLIGAASETAVGRNPRVARDRL